MRTSAFVGLVLAATALGSPGRAWAQTPGPVSPHAVDPRVCIPVSPRGSRAAAPSTLAGADSALDRFVRTDIVADLQRALQQLADLDAHVLGSPRGQPDSARVAILFRGIHLADSVQAALHAVGMPSTQVFPGPLGEADAEAKYEAAVAENQRRYDASMCAAGVRWLEERVVASLVGWIHNGYGNDLRAQSQLAAEARAAGITSATFAQINRLSLGALSLPLDDSRPPKFELVMPAAPRANSFIHGEFNFGDTIRVALEGRLLAGGPVVGGVVHWSASYQANGSYPTRDRYRIGWAQDTAIIPSVEGMLALDDSGRAVLAIPTPAGVAARDFLAVTATLSAPDGPSVTLKRLAAVASDSLFVGLRPGTPPQADKRWHAGDNYTFDVAAMDLDGHHLVGTALRVLAVRTAVYTPKCGLGTSVQRDTLFYKEIVTSGDPASFAVTIPSSGNFDVCVSAEDPRGRQVAAGDWVPVRP